MTSKSSPSVRFAAWGALGLVIAAVVVLFVRSQAVRSNLPHLGQIQPFALTNQLGSVVSARDLRGKVWVADIIFSRCPGPCPRMTEQMSKLQKAFRPADRLALVTLTTDPEYDTPEKLKIYSEKFAADPNRWFFLTGTKPQIRDVALGSLKLATEDKEPGDRESENDLFIHTTIFVLVDKSGGMRAVYESLEPGFQEKIQADIQGLLREN